MTKEAKPGKDAEPRADRWIGRLRDNPVIATLIVVGVVLGAVIGVWEQASKLYRDLFETKVALTAFHLSTTGADDINEEQLTCRFDDKNMRTFLSDASSKINRTIPLDFVFTNQANVPAVFSQVSLVVAAAETVSGGTPGIVRSNHTYQISLKHQTGTQRFPLVPVYNIPANETGSFTLEFSPEGQGIGKCWIMHAVFRTNLGDVATPTFSLIMSNFSYRRR